MEKISEVLLTMRNMVDSFVNRHWSQWEDYRDKFKAEHGYEKGVPLSLQSYVGTDLLIDMPYLVRDIEQHDYFTNEYWIRSQGTQCIRSDKDRENNALWGDVLGKFTITKDATGFSFAWIEDDQCLIKNQLLQEGILHDRW